MEDPSAPSANDPANLRAKTIRVIKNWSKSGNGDGNRASVDEGGFSNDTRMKFVTALGYDPSVAYYWKRAEDLDLLDSVTQELGDEHGGGSDQPARKVGRKKKKKKGNNGGPIAVDSDDGDEPGIDGNGGNGGIMMIRFITERGRAVVRDEASSSNVEERSRSRSREREETPSREVMSAITERRSTPLHFACTIGDSLSSSARRQLNNSPPHHVFVKDRDFHTPLYYALDNGLDHDVCMSMIQRWRAWETKYGSDWAQAHRDTALVAAACSTKCGVKIFREVLTGTDAYPNPTASAMEHGYGHRPLEILWTTFLNSLQHRVLLARATKRGKKLLKNDAIKLLLRKSSLLLEALEHSTSLSDPTTTTRPFIPSQDELSGRMTHLSIEFSTWLDRHGRLTVSFDFLYLLFRVFPEQLLRHDDKQRTPLHIALGKNGQTAVNIVSDIARVCPRAASALSANGRMPVCLAIESGRPWTCGMVKSLVLAAPNALMTRDIKTHLFPFMLAASKPEGTCEEENASYSDITTIFELLRASPHHVQRAQQVQGDI